MQTFLSIRYPYSNADYTNYDMIMIIMMTVLAVVIAVVKFAAFIKVINTNMHF